MSVYSQKSSPGEFCRISTFFALLATRLCLPGIKLRSKNYYIPLNKNNCILVNKMNNFFKIILYYERKIHCVPATPPQLWINTEEIAYSNLLHPKYCCGENLPFLSIIGSIILNFYTCPIVWKRSLWI